MISQFYQQAESAAASGHLSAAPCCPDCSTAGATSSVQTTGRCKSFLVWVRRNSTVREEGEDRAMAGDQMKVDDLAVAEDRVMASDSVATEDRGEAEDRVMASDSVATEDRGEAEDSVDNSRVRKFDIGITR